MQRRFAASLITRRTMGPVSCLTAMRLGHPGKPTVHDHSGMFSRPLTAEEQMNLDDQVNYRTVSRVVPGKVFMRHFIANEQAAHSIVNRALSLVFLWGLMMWGSCYYTNGVNSYSWLTPFFFIFVVTYLEVHLHMISLYYVAIPLLLAWLFLY